jgi:hypothetical protein
LPHQVLAIEPKHPTAQLPGMWLISPWKTGIKLVIKMAIDQWKSIAEAKSWLEMESKYDHVNQLPSNPS